MDQMNIMMTESNQDVVVDTKQVTALNDLQLALIGGGCGEVVFG